MGFSLGDFGKLTNKISGTSLLGISDRDSERIADPLDLLGIQGTRAADDAASIQSQNYLKALEEIKRQFDISQGNIDPFIQAGQGQLPFLEQGASIEGLDQQLGDIMNTDMFGELVEDRTRSVEGLLGAGGLSRSGSAIEEGARIPTDLALTISNILNGRASSLATGGQNAAVGAGSLSGQFSGQQAQLQGLSGNALASGILGGQQAQAQGAQTGAAILAKIFGFG